MTQTPTKSDQPVAVVTGASRGLGLALAEQLVDDGWHVVVDARDGERLADAVRALDPRSLTVVPGDVTDPAHRRALVDAARAAGGLDLLVANASRLGPSPQPALEDYPLDVLQEVYAVNVLAPLALVQLALPLLRAAHDRTGRTGTVVAVSSDAAVEPYEGWGGYGSSKAALDQLAAVLAAEQPQLRVHAVDPGDMRTQMHQEAFPDDDISDRPLPQTVVPVLLRLVAQERPSGRYRAADLAAELPAELTAELTAEVPA
ncbi:SDR family oxidoreductase [Angustibacter peucedani]